MLLMRDKFSELIKDDLACFNRDLISNSQTNVKDFADVLEYIFAAPGKQIRPVLGILLAKNLTDTFSNDMSLFLQAIELIHNATLFHDDIIDNSKIRRNRNALQEEFSNKIAVLSGDYFLSVAIKIIYSLNNQQINKLISDYMKLICEGEIEQNYSLNKIISIDEYISKTKRKTALLFELTTTGITLLTPNAGDKLIDIAKKIGENFGILFQLKDDLNNFGASNDKPVFNDLKSGVITAPVLFLSQEFDDIEKLILNENYDEILDRLNNSQAIAKTENLIADYSNNLKASINLLPQNIYSEALSNLFSEI